MVFLKFAAKTPRLLRLVGATKDELALQFDVHRRGSSSAIAVDRRARFVASFFMDLAVLCWTILSIDEWRVVAWVKSQVARGIKTAATTARNTLISVSEGTDINLWLVSPLGRTQLSSRATFAI